MSHSTTDKCFSPIDDYAIIGDCRAAALVSKHGSIDWLCWPRFDKPSIFAALLDPERGGFWRICPTTCEKVDRQYIPETNVLQTRFVTSSGSILLTDLMPMESASYAAGKMAPDHEVIRRVECTQGQVEVEVVFTPCANYGQDPTNIKQTGKLGLRVEHRKGVYWLRGNTSFAVTDNQAKAITTIKYGGALNFSFSYSEEAPAVLPPVDDSIGERITRTITWWQDWAKLAEYDGNFRADVLRSALALKLLSYTPSGAIIAAATTSLPEKIGGSLNWDYRFCWLRDASLTIRALLELGYWQEAGDFLGWTLHATRLTQPKLRILYSLFGESPPAEKTLDHLCGYKNSRPVRIGNAARDQVQLDVYGEVIDAAAQYAFHGGGLDREMQKALIGFGNYVASHWNEPDQGIWEPRSGPQHHTHSRLLCWTALDRLISLQEKGALRGAPLELYKKNAEEIRKQIRERAWNEQMQSYVSILDGDCLDASLLLLSWYGFEKADSQRMQGTYQKIKERLGTRSGLIYRYESKNEGTFAICSFWEAEFLALGGGSLDEAKQFFHRLLNYSNDLGLYGEEIEPDTGATLGNFPQAFTHIGLIGAALSIAQREKGEQQLAHRPEKATKQEPTAEVSA
jgi:GH15 family glucan-1,4-alpha-glucosidase